MKLLNMKQFILIVFLGLSIPVLTFSQANPVQNASIPKDAPIDVTVSDFKNNLKANEIIVFKSKINSKESQGLTDDNGKFSISLPAGDKYEIFILGFKDSTSYNILDIPATTGNACLLYTSRCV